MIHHDHKHNQTGTVLETDAHILHGKVDYK